jgi:plasmid stability protein
VTTLHIRDMPDDALDVRRDRAARRDLSLGAYAREVLIREAARTIMDETLAGRRLIAGRRLTARELKQVIATNQAAT